MIWGLSLYVVRKHAAEAQALCSPEFLTPEELAERIAADLREMGFAARVVATDWDAPDPSPNVPGAAVAVEKALVSAVGVEPARNNGSDPSSPV
jgi:hypothetical protein